MSKLLNFKFSFWSFLYILEITVFETVDHVRILGCEAVTLQFLGLVCSRTVVCGSVGNSGCEEVTL